MTRYPRHCIVAALVFAPLAAMPIAAGANPVDPAKPATISKKVSLADYPLSTPEGARLARQRIESAVRQLCRELRDTRKVEDREAFAACVTESLADAMRRFDARQIIAGN